MKQFFQKIISFFLSILSFFGLYHAKQPTPAPIPALAGESGYLFVHFTGNEPERERIHFALSADGYNFYPLNGGKEVFTQKGGTGCVRDPYILRGEDGTFYIVGTDMKSSNGWLSNHALVTWQSKDLIHWTDETIIDIRDFGGSFAATNRAWAPQAIWDSDAGRYMVYWAHSTPDTNAAIYYAYTDDFKTLTTPQPLYQNSGMHTIDADIVYNEANGFYYMYFKDEDGFVIDFVKSQRLTGPYDGAPVRVSHSPNAVEGCQMYPIAGTNTWVMLMDEYGKGRFVMETTSDFETFTPLADSDYGFHDVIPRHGSVLPITAEEYDALVKTFAQ